MSDVKKDHNIGSGTGAVGVPSVSRSGPHRNGPEEGASEGAATDSAGRRPTGAGSRSSSSALAVRGWGCRSP